MKYVEEKELNMRNAIGGRVVQSVSGAGRRTRNYRNVEIAMRFTIDNAEVRVG